MSIEKLKENPAAAISMHEFSRAKSSSQSGSDNNHHHSSNQNVGSVDVQGVVRAFIDDDHLSESLITITGDDRVDEVVGDLVVKPAVDEVRKLVRTHGKARVLIGAGALATTAGVLGILASRLANKSE